MFKKYRSISLSILIIILLICFFKYTKPTIKINNKTNDDIFVFFGTSEKGVDPSYEEIKRGRRYSIISQWQSLEIPISVSDYFLDGGQVNIGWRIGGLKWPSVKKIGYNTFDIVPGSKYCTYNIDIYYDKTQVSNKDDGICMQSLQEVPNVPLIN